MKKYRPQSTDHKVQTTKYRPQSTDHKVQTTKYRPQSTDHKVQTTKYRPQSTDHKVQTTKYRTQSTDHKEQGIGSRSSHDLAMSRQVTRLSIHRMTEKYSAFNSIPHRFLMPSSDSGLALKPRFSPPNINVVVAPLPSCEIIAAARRETTNGVGGLQLANTTRITETRSYQRTKYNVIK